jgi:hypothetical protein
MNFEMVFEYFILNIFPPFLLIIGMIGNSLGFIVLTSKTNKLSKLSVRNLMRFIAILDTLYLFQIIADYLTNSYNLDIRLISRYWCKLFVYFNYCICPISSWLIVFVSVERMASITSPRLAKIFNKHKFQFRLCLFIIIFNLIYYAPFVLFNDLITVEDNSNNTNNVVCTYVNDIYSEALPLMDLFNSALIPFIILTLTSINTIYNILKPRGKFSNNQSDNQNNSNNTNRNEKFKKDIKFAITLIILNIIYLFFNLPICITNYIDTTDFIYILTLYIFYAHFATNFWIFFIFNSLFRNELIYLLFKIKS